MAYSVNGKSLHGLLWAHIANGGHIPFVQWSNQKGPALHLFLQTSNHCSSFVATVCPHLAFICIHQNCFP